MGLCQLGASSTHSPGPLLFSSFLDQRAVTFVSATFTLLILYPTEPYPNTKVFADPLDKVKFLYFIGL